jgi:hypothetical protein
MLIHGGGEHSDNHPRHGYLGDDPDGGPFSSLALMLPSSSDALFESQFRQKDHPVAKSMLDTDRDRRHLRD